MKAVVIEEPNRMKVSRIEARAGHQGEYHTNDCEPDRPVRRSAFHVTHTETPLSQSDSRHRN